MLESYLDARLGYLKKSQNADGGWGYLPGKRSWLEPTVYAMLALNSEAGSAACQRAWSLVRSWQREDGAWRPSEQVKDAHWSTALVVTLHSVKGVFDEAWDKGVRWLLESSGMESSLLVRISRWARRIELGYDASYPGWPWLPGTNGWIEPTAHSLVALKKAAGRFRGALLRRRVVLGEGMLLRRRCSDGGWNYGSVVALGVEQPSYPETTALALLGLQGTRHAEVASAIERAIGMLREASSPLAQAWLRISLRNYGAPAPAPDPATPVPRSILLAALEALAAPGGGHALLKPVTA